MPKSSSIWPPNNTGAILRLAVVVLAVVNLTALYFVLRPLGGSPEELRERAIEMKGQVRQRQGNLERTRKLVAKIEAGRAEGDQFLNHYFLPRRSAYPQILAELTKAASDAKIKPKESAFATELIDGSDTLSLMQISANYEGSYPDLLRFINLIDKSNSLLIVEGLNATPQQGSPLLSVTLKLDTFV